MEITAGQGVDVVLNSLSGDAIEASLEVLAPDGRFIELGKTDLYAGRPPSARHFQKRLSYSAVDLAGLAAQRPERFAALRAEVMELFARGVLHAPPIERVPLTEASTAFVKMARARHVGKLVLGIEGRGGAGRAPRLRAGARPRQRLHHRRPGRPGARRRPLAGGARRGAPRADGALAALTAEQGRPSSRSRPAAPA